MSDTDIADTTLHGRYDTDVAYMTSLKCWDQPQKTTTNIDTNAEISDHAL